MPFAATPMRLAAAATALLLAANAPGQPPPPKVEEEPLPQVVSEFGGRYDGLRLLLHELSDRSAVLATSAQLKGTVIGDYRNWIVLSLGDPEPLLSIGMNWRRFLDAGGVLVVATDEELGPIVDGYPGWFGEGPVEAGRDVDRYLGRPLCPIVTRLDGAHPLFAGVKALALNQTGFLAGIDRRLGAIAHLPRMCRVGDGLLDPPPPVIAAANFNAGRLVYLADPSVLTNEMLLELDNLLFARNLAQWSLAGKDPPQSKVLLLEDGEEAFLWIDARFPTGDWAGPTLDKLIALLNETVAGLEDEDVFNKVLYQKQERFDRPPFRRGLLIVPTVVAAIALLAWLLRRRTPIVPSDAAAISSSGEVLPERDYRAAGRLLAEDFLSRTLSPPGEGGVGPGPSGPGGWLARWRWRRRLERVRRLAQETRPTWLGRRGYARLVRDIDTLRAGLNTETASAASRKESSFGQHHAR